MALELFHWFIVGFLLILPILYELSGTFRYHAKFTLYYACIFGIATVVCTYSWLRPGDVNNHWFIIWSMNHVKNLFGIEVEIKGKENLDSDKPYILVINHQSSLDCIGMFVIWPSRGCALMKKDLKYAGPFGLAATLCGSVFIDRLNREKALATMQNTAKIIHERNFWCDGMLSQVGKCPSGDEITFRDTKTNKSSFILSPLENKVLKGMTQVWPKRCCCLVKNELKYAGSFGLAALLCGTVFIDRLNREKALDTMKKTAGTILSRNIKLLVFPEGTRNHDGSMMPFKKGAFHLAVQAQIPVVPVVFSSYTEFYNKKDKKIHYRGENLPRKRGFLRIMAAGVIFEMGTVTFCLEIMPCITGLGKFIITCLPSISTRGLTASDVTDLTENVRKQMLDTFNQTSFEATQNKLASKITNGTK